MIDRRSQLRAHLDAAEVQDLDLELQDLDAGIRRWIRLVFENSIAAGKGPSESVPSDRGDALAAYQPGAPRSVDHAPSMAGHHDREDEAVRFDARGWYTESRIIRENQQVDADPSSAKPRADPGRPSALVHAWPGSSLASGSRTRLEGANDPCVSLGTARCASHRDEAAPSDPDPVSVSLQRGQRLLRRMLARIASSSA